MIVIEIVFGVSDVFYFFFNDTATPEIYPLSLHDALPIFTTGRLRMRAGRLRLPIPGVFQVAVRATERAVSRSEEHTSELQSQSNLVCRLLLEKKKQKNMYFCQASRTSRLDAVAQPRRSLD